MASVSQTQYTPRCTSENVLDTVLADSFALQREDIDDAGSITSSEPDLSEVSDTDSNMRQEAGRRQEEERRFEAARFEEQLEVERFEQGLWEQVFQEQERRQAEQQRREAEAKAQCKAGLVSRWELKAAEARKSRENEAQEEQERRARADALALARFLKEHNFTGANAKRRNLFRFKYPLHTAVKLQDTDTIRVLLASRADPALKNSSGETPLELAARLFKGDDLARTLVQCALRS